jgi:hypothetical protein
MEKSKYEAETHTSKNNSLHESRFKVLLFLYRISGFPLKVDSTSRLKTVYNAIVIVSFYITTLCISVDTFVYRHQLALAMKRFRLVLMAYTDMWLQLSVR